MKKYLLIVLCALVLVTVTGCGSSKKEENGNGGTSKNQVVCTASQEENGIKMTAEIVAEFDSADKLTDAVVSYDLNDEDTAKQYCTLFKLMEDTEKGVTVECSGSKITVKGYANIETSEEDDKAMKGASKEEFIKYVQSSEDGNFTCK
jgi:hypothetical protein